MFRYIFLFLFVSISLFASGLKIIPPENAFEVSFEQKDNFLTFKIEMEEGVYLLDDKIAFEVEKPKKLDFTGMVNAPSAQMYKNQKVHFNSYSASIAEDFLLSQKIGGKVLIKVSYQGCAAGGVICYPPMFKTYEINMQKTFSSEQNAIADILQNKNLFFTLFSFFGFGLLLSLTPCTFPMIPIISSIIASYGNQQMNAKKGFWLSFVYVFFMSLAYSIVGVVAGIFGANMQIYMQNAWVISAFSAIFVILALAMFEVFSFGLPSIFQNKIFNIGGGKKGVAGVAIIGFFSALIVGPCMAAPLMGALIYISQSGNMFLGGSALFVMSVGMGVPLMLIGLSAGKFLPKPGPWMNKIQKIFGFIMLGVAVWMISRVISASIALILCALLLIGFGIYLFLAFAPKNIWLKLLKILSVLIVLYGVVLFCGGLKGGSYLFKPIQNFSKTIANKIDIDFTDVKNLNDLEQILTKSKQPAMLEFTASWCAICTEFEEKTLSQKSVQERLKNFLVLRADVTKNSEEDKELMRKFNIYGPPAIIFFKNGEELKDFQIIGFQNAKDFLAHLDLVEK